MYIYRIAKNGNDTFSRDIIVRKHIYINVFLSCKRVSNFQK